MEMEKEKVYVGGKRRERFGGGGGVEGAKWNKE